MTAFNYWHFIVLSLIFILFLLGSYNAIQQKDTKTKLGMFFTVSLVTLFLAIFSVIIVDKYTKHVKLYKLKNRRLLSTEQIIYSGIVKNVGHHRIGKVTFEIKLVNQGNATGGMKGKVFYKSSGLFDFFNNGLHLKSKPQSLTKEFVVARNLKAGEIKVFRVYFKYPPYFRSPSQFPKVWGH